MNGDLLTKVDFRGLLDYHKEHKSTATMCVKEFDFQVPYGVIRVDDQEIKQIDEKPVHKFLINAGIYVLGPETVKDIPEDSFFDMTHLFNKLRESQKSTLVFPIHEYWLDIGTIQDFARAQIDYEQKF